MPPLGGVCMGYHASAAPATDPTGGGIRELVSFDGVFTGYAQVIHYLT